VFPVTKATGNVPGKVDTEAPAVHQLTGWLIEQEGNPDGDALAVSPLGVAAQAARERIEASLERLTALKIEFATRPEGG
jgi:hypothetical protein